MQNFKKIFLNSEGDNWFKRTIKLRKKKKYYDDDYSKEIIKLIKRKKERVKILDVGTSDGGRLRYIKNILKKKNIDFYGLEPSKKAIKYNYDKRIKIKKGPADKIPYKKNTFNIILFSLCLYLCDTRLLPQIASEALRVSKKNANIIIFDFYSAKTVYKNYKHILNSKIRKMDNAKIFKFFSNIKLVKRKIFSYNLFYNLKKNSFDKNDKLAIHILEKIKVDKKNDY